MTPRLDASKVSPDAYRAIMGLELYVRHSGLEPSLIELIKLRASYMNGCAYCVDMHSKDARVDGETEQRIYAVPVWRETPFFSDRERAALAFTEAVTAIGQAGVPDDVYDEAKRFFSQDELVKLTMAIVTINAWNRVAITFRTEPGTYQPRARQPEHAAHA
ncbi:MAG TPA: carboxymuconolactone decarboxylase family protein [Gemmatimonadaceae bacterium]|nr:carboxymuconolactone decarboxylase family protein [Gemmatimonadaceae bacterium]